MFGVSPLVLWGMGGQIFDACYHGMPDLLEKCILEGEDVNTRADGDMTPLMYAASRGHLDCIRILLDNGARVNDSSIMGITALFVATWHNQIDCAKFLLYKGADPFRRAVNGMTPYEIQEWFRRKDVIYKPYLKLRMSRFIGLIRTIPMMMLWRKRATERLYHPSRIDFSEWVS